jgi:hypothetical protein
MAMIDAEMVLIPVWVISRDAPELLPAVECHTSTWDLLSIRLSLMPCLHET